MNITLKVLGIAILLTLTSSIASASNLEQEIPNLEFRFPEDRNKAKLFTKYFKPTNDSTSLLPCEDEHGYKEECIGIMPGYSIYKDKKQDNFAFVSQGITYGGTGILAYMWGVYRTKDGIISTQPIYVGDRIIFEAVTCIKNELRIDALVNGPNDPLCCPSKKAVLKYAIKDGTIVKVK